MYCYKCGNNLETNYDFCPKCGTKCEIKSTNENKNESKDENEVASTVEPKAENTVKEEIVKEDLMANYNFLEDVFSKLQNVHKLITLSVYFFIYAFTIPYIGNLPALADSFFTVCFIFIFIFSILNGFIIGSYGYRLNLKVETSVVLFFAIIFSLYIGSDARERLFDPGSVIGTAFIAGIFLTVLHLIVYIVIERLCKKYSAMK